MHILSLSLSAHTAMLDIKQGLNSFLLKTVALTENSFPFFLIKIHSHSFLTLSWVRFLEAGPETEIVLHVVY